MDDREFEKELQRLMGQDFSAGTSAFREDLLNRCLSMLNADVDDNDEGVCLDDAELEMLSAAGDMSLLDAPRWNREL